MIALETLNSADGINGGSNFLLLQDADEAVRIAREIGKLWVVFFYMRWTCFSEDALD